ncbi:MAG: hypothetical protein K9N06_10410 [Candidatus Cloacimonetes bacterium]|nr:hypothetical protein [Candidatus Cloacimonadota bacterium]
MKKIMLFVFLAIVTLMMVISCSENDNNNNIPDIIYAYALEQFVPMDALSDLIVHDEGDTTEFRDLFYFWPLATDGFSARTRGYDDLDWQNWVQGYYIPEIDNKVFFPQFEPLNIGAYNVKYLDMVYVSRGVRSIINDTLSVVYELNAMETQQVENYDLVMEDAIPLNSFVPPHVTVIDSVVFTAVDGYTKTYTPVQFADGYWLVSSQKTIFPTEGANMSGSLKKFKLLKSMEFFGQWQNVEDFENPAWAGTDEADWSFSFPVDLSAFEGIVWE